MVIGGDDFRFLSAGLVGYLCRTFRFKCSFLSNTYPPLMNYAQEKLADHLSDVEKRKIPTGVKEMAAEMEVSVGFTINRLAALLTRTRFGEVTPEGEVRLLGWMFWMPNNPPEHNNKLIRDITVEQLSIIITDTGSKLERTPLLHPDSGTSVELSPKIFYQQKELASSDLLTTYQEAFDQTLPRFLPDMGIPVSDLEEYENWTDFAYLSASDLQTMKMMVTDDATIYSDVFFSGARINYATSHNPLMRVEQINLVNKHTNERLAPISHLPFTLKAEYYVASDDDRRNWLRSPGETGSALPPPDPRPTTDQVNRSVNDNESVQPQKGTFTVGTGNPKLSATSQAFIPGNILLSPCPPVWIIPPQVGMELKKSFPSLGLAEVSNLSVILYDSLTNPGEKLVSRTLDVENITTDKIQQPQSSSTVNA